MCQPDGNRGEQRLRHGRAQLRTANGVVQYAGEAGNDGVSTAGMDNALHGRFEHACDFCDGKEVMRNRSSAYGLKPVEKLHGVAAKRRQPQLIETVTQFCANQKLPIMIHIHASAPPEKGDRYAASWLMKYEIR